MPTLRSILKYTPAVVLGLLVVAWICGYWGWMTYSMQVKDGQFAGGIGRGHIKLWTSRIDPGWELAFGGLDWGSYRPYHDNLSNFRRGSGGLWHSYRPSDSFLLMSFPILMVLTFLLPFAIAPFTSFRFRLWHYLAYTALLGVELAYYLRWQD